MSTYLSAEDQEAVGDKLHSLPSPYSWFHGVSASWFGWFDSNQKQSLELSSPEAEVPQREQSFWAKNCNAGKCA